MNYWSLTASSKNRVVHRLGISSHWLHREPTLMRSCRSKMFTNWVWVSGPLKQNNVQVLTSLPWEHEWVWGDGGWGVGGWGVCVCVYGSAWENIHQTLKNVWRTQSFSFSTQKQRANSSQNARGKHSSNSVRSKGADQRGGCLQFRPTRQFLRRLPGERAQREINLRYQFAEFCSIDERVPRDVTQSAQQLRAVNTFT